MCINKINRYIENRRFIKYIITLTLGLPTIFKVCRQLFNLYTDCCYLFYMVSVQYLYFLAGCEPLEKRLKADAVPSVFTFISRTAMVQLARQCRRARTVALNNVSLQTPHTAVDVGQTIQIDCEICKSS